MTNTASNLPNGTVVTWDNHSTGPTSWDNIPRGPVTATITGYSVFTGLYRVCTPDGVLAYVAVDDLTSIVPPLQSPTRFNP